MNKTLTLGYKCGQFEDFEEMKNYKKIIIIITKRKLLYLNFEENKNYASINKSLVRDSR